MDDTTLEALMTDNEVSELLGRSTQTLANWRTAGIGPAWIRNPDTGRFLGYRRDDVASWLRRGEDDGDE